MDDYTPLWAEPMISTAAFVAAGDRLLCPVSIGADMHYYEVVNRELGSLEIVFTIEEDLGSGVKARRKIVKQKTDSVAYQKRLE